MTAEALVYLLCLGASALCAVLLIRAWRRTREPLLFWSALCFCFLALNNLTVVADMLIWRDGPDLTYLRQAFALTAVGVLLYGFIWRSE